MLRLWELWSSEGCGRGTTWLEFLNVEGYGRILTVRALAAVGVWRQIAETVRENVRRQILVKPYGSFKGADEVQSR